MNPKVSTWHAQRNNIDGSFRLSSPETGFLLDAATGEPALLTGAEAQRAADAMCQLVPANNKIAERVS